MSYFQRPVDVAPEDQTEQHEQPRPAGFRLGDFRGRLARAFFERRPDDDLSLEQGEQADWQGGGSGPRWLQGEEEEHDVVAEVPAPGEDGRFPLGPLGYNRAAVDQRIAELERVLAEREREVQELREHTPPAISITEEIERLGEQTASILVVAHDQAHETTRLAQEQADRCLADAASNAVAMTERAKRNLRELDSETDAVWEERTRLLDDARNVGLALIALAEEAVERFPPEVKTTDSPVLAE